MTVKRLTRLSRADILLDLNAIEAHLRQVRPSFVAIRPPP